MLAIGFENDGVRRPADAQQHQGDTEVDARRRQRDGRADAEALERLWRDQTLDGKPEDACRRDDDEGALQAAREILNLLMAVRVGGIDGFRRVPEAQVRS